MRRLSRLGQARRPAKNFAFKAFGIKAHDEWDPHFSETFPVSFEV
jgi:hypothetical protein